MDTGATGRTRWTNLPMKVACGGIVRNLDALLTATLQQYKLNRSGDSNRLAESFYLGHSRTDTGCRSETLPSRFSGRGPADDVLTATRQRYKLSHGGD